ncbi:(2Fe-2S)-binding protein [Methylomonas sp. AM2-LC]|uniref:(2Fe-2S)-binding protein n=1 Tax=Methylomonas sp. AM2-LC TaxID=3153301 RepID=UPI003266527F
MYICLCQGVTERDIEQSVNNGICTTFQDLRQELQVSVDCGRCSHAARQCLKQAKKNSSQTRQAA